MFFMKYFISLPNLVLSSQNAHYSDMPLYQRSVSGQGTIDVFGGMIRIKPRIQNLGYDPNHIDW